MAVHKLVAQYSITMSFTMSHTVTLPYPLSTVFPVLSERSHMERLQRLTPEAQQFTLLPTDHVQLPLGGLTPLITPKYPSYVKGLPRPREMETCASTDGAVERTWFEFGGMVPLMFGLIEKGLSVAGAQIVDVDAHIVLFESGVAASGIKEVKLRTFEEVDLEDGKKVTKVKETVWGTCPLLLSYLLKIVAPGVHRHHMEIYYKLFE